MLDLFFFQKNIKMKIYRNPKNVVGLEIYKESTKLLKNVNIKNAKPSEIPSNTDKKSQTNIEIDTKYCTGSKLN